ncbi:MAG TPA: O-antigen ligase family protein [Bryobacteraceae bacterium]|nr:O-antigen ligase family protein [Bryobacteraceae bacterium]
MGRLNNPQIVLAAEPPVRVAPIVALQAPDAGLGQRAGFALLCIFTISGYANEFATRLFHVKAYISTVSWVLLPVLLILSGNVFRAFRDPIGRLWALFLAWILLATPFSVWRGGSVTLLLDYIPHGWIQLHYFAAFAITVRHLRRLMFFLIASDVLLLIDCLWGGSMQTGRLEIPDSMFFRNANDLSLQLLIAVTQFVYLLYQPGLWKRVAGGAGMAAAMVFMLETGARGAFLAALVLGVAGLALTRHRIRTILWAAPVAAAAMLIAPSGVFHRVTLIGSQSDAVASDALDQAALGSQTQRIALLRQSAKYALLHPLLGVGPGQFAVAASKELTREGKQAPWLGTHNSYTEIASECGLPALLLYSAVIFLVLRSNLRIYRQADGRRAAGGDAGVSALAFCLFASALAYAVDTLFFHVAYSSYLPAIAGMSIALRLALERRNETA